MRTFNLKKDNIINVLEYFLAFIIILESNSIFSQIYGYHKIIRILFVLFAVICIVGLIILNKCKFDKNFLYFLLVDFIISILLVINTKSITGLGIIGLVFLGFTSLLFLYFQGLSLEKIKGFLGKFVNVVCVLALISLVFYSLSSVFNVIEPTGMIKVLWGKPYSEIETYYYLHFNTQTIYWLTGGPVVRNTGIYTEGPMYALIILLSIMFNVLIVDSGKKIDYIKSVVLFFTMITTFSVTGIIGSVIVLFYYFIRFFKKLEKNSRKMFVYLFIFIIILLLPFGVSILDKKMATSSSSHRKMDIINGFNSFVEDPIIGKGINHERFDELNPEVGYGYSNAIIPVATDGGIILSCIYFLPTILLLVYSIREKKVNYLLFVVVFYILLFTTLFQYRLTMMLLLLLQFFVFNKECSKEVG